MRTRSPAEDLGVLIGNAAENAQALLAKVPQSRMWLERKSSRSCARLACFWRKSAYKLNVRNSSCRLLAAECTAMSKTRLDRRRFVGAVAVFAAGPLGLLSITKRLRAMTDVMPELAEGTAT